MNSVTRPLASAFAVFAAVLLVAGCTANPGSSTPTSSSAPSADSSDDQNDVEGVLLDDGRSFAVVTWGSSTCVPQVAEATADGQTVTVTLADPQSDDGTEKACTADIAPRASVGGLPEGVDPTKDITLQVNYGDLKEDVDLDGDADAKGTPGSPTEYQPSAGWFDDESLVLLTWGSSTCAPVVESLTAAGNKGTATFVTDEKQVCTMDMAPRATILSFGDDEIDDDGTFTLTLTGGGLDGDVEVRRP